MHQLLVDVALGGAEAFTQSSRPGRMSQNVLLRVDIALTQHGDTVSPYAVLMHITNKVCHILFLSKHIPEIKHCTKTYYMRQPHQS